MRKKKKEREKERKIDKKKLGHKYRKHKNQKVYLNFVN